MNFILETLGKVGFEWRMALFNLVNFLVIFWILKKFAFGPVQAMIEDRQTKAQASVENFQRAKTELEMAQRKAQEIVDESKVEANKIVEAAADDAKESAELLKSKAKHEIELLVAQAKRNIDIDKKEMKDQLRKETADMVMVAVEKILSEKMTDKKDQTYISEMLASLN